MAKTKQPKGQRLEDGIGAKLTRQETFCRLLALENMTPMEAYVQAFEWKGDADTARKSALSLLAVPEIAERVEALQPFQIDAPSDGDMLSLQEHLAELAQLERLAVRQGQIGPAITAAIARGKASGLYVERSITAHVTLEDIIAGSRQDGSIETPEARVIGQIKGKHSSGRELPPGPNRSRGSR